MVDIREMLVEAQPQPGVKLWQLAEQKRPRRHRSLKILGYERADVLVAAPMRSACRRRFESSAYCHI